MGTTVSHNIASLGLIQVANYLIPLVLIPIVVRIFGVEIFGRISYAQNIVNYLTIVVNFGFEYSATRQVALADSQEERRRIFWSVMWLKMALLAVSMVALLVLTLTMDTVAAEGRLYLYTALTNIGFVLFPTWFLQGVQNMGRMALTNFVIKLGGAVLILAMIHSAEQYRLYPLLLSVANIVGGVWCMVYVIRKYNLGSTIWDERCVRECLLLGLPIFINNVFVSLYTIANMTILGRYVGEEEIGYFSGAQRLILAINMCVVMPVSTAFFPKISRMMEENKQAGLDYLKRVLVWACAASAVVSVVTWVSAPLVVRIMLGAKFVASVALLRQMAILPLLIMTATLLTVQGLYGLGLQRMAPWVGAILATLCVSLNTILIPQLGSAGAIWSWIAAQTAEVLIVGGVIWWKSKELSVES